jgi:hypothetical protein
VVVFLQQAIRLKFVHKILFLVEIVCPTCILNPLKLIEDMICRLEFSMRVGNVLMTEGHSDMQVRM